MPSQPHRFCSVLVAATVAATVLAGQTRQPATPADYGKFETLVTQPRGGLSPDGRWLAYGINRSNRENELRVTSVASSETKTICVRIAVDVLG